MIKENEKTAGGKEFEQYASKYAAQIQKQIAAQNLHAVDDSSAESVDKKARHKTPEAALKAAGIKRWRKDNAAGVDAAQNENQAAAVDDSSGNAEGVENQAEVIFGVQKRRGRAKRSVEKTLSDYEDYDFLNMPTLARLLQVSLPTAHKVARQFKTLTRFKSGKRAHFYIRAFELKEFLAKGGVEKNV